MLGGWKLAAKRKKSIKSGCLIFIEGDNFRSSDHVMIKCPVQSFCFDHDLFSPLADFSFLEKLMVQMNTLLSGLVMS